MDIFGNDTPWQRTKFPQPKDRTPVKEIHRWPNTKWAAVTRPRQQGTRIAMPTTTEMEHAPLHNGISQVKAALANKHRRRSRKVAIVNGHAQAITWKQWISRFPLRHAPLAWEPPWHITQDLITIVKSEVWTICYCSSLGHESMACAVCLPLFIWIHCECVIWSYCFVEHSFTGIIAPNLVPSLTWSITNLPGILLTFDT